MTKWDGTNSIELRHREDEHLRDIMESDEVGQSAPCEACDERTVEEINWCIGTDTPSTAYCVGNHKKGCILKLSGRCLGHTTKMICNRCGQVQGE